MDKPEKLSTATTRPASGPTISVVSGLIQPRFGATPSDWNASRSIESPTIQFTRLTNKNGLLTKEYRLDDESNLVNGTKAFLTEGTATRVTVATIREFSAAHKALKSNECFAYGVTDPEVADIVVKSKLQEHPGKIARDRKHFLYRKAPAILMLDYDPDPSRASLDPEALRIALISACPSLKDAPMLWAASASSNIYDIKTGQELRGLRGQRLYIAVKDGTDIFFSART